MKHNYKQLDTISAFFVATLLISNILSSAKLVDFGMSAFGIPLSFDGGLVIFPLCYIFGDILTEVYGYRRSRKVIWLGFLSSLLLVGLVKLLKELPGEPSWLEGGGAAGYQMIFFGLYSGGLILASLVAYLTGEFINAVVLAKLKLWSKGRFTSLRFMLSTVFGQFFDTGIFLTIACLTGVFPFSLWLSLFITNYVIKLLVEFLLLPVSLRITSWLKKHENSDYYDTSTNFNPFIFAAD